MMTIVIGLIIVLVVTFMVNVTTRREAVARLTRRWVVRLVIMTSLTIFLTGLFAWFNAMDEKSWAWTRNTTLIHTKSGSAFMCLQCKHVIGKFHIIIPQEDGTWWRLCTSID